MPLYIGYEQVQINLDSILYKLNLFYKPPTINGDGLLSLDNYILRDSNGIYILPSDYLNPVAKAALQTLDGYILKDSNGVYLTIKESE